MNEYEITLADGRRITLKAYSEEDARRQGALWGELNPADKEVSTFEVTMDDGQTFMVPATSEEAAREFIASWGPTERANANEEERRAQREQFNLGYDAADNAANAFTLGLDKLSNASISALATGFQNLTGDGPGYGMREAFDASRRAQNDEQAEWQQENQLLATGSGLLGALGTPGVGRVGELVAGREGAGLLMTPGVLPTAGRGAVAGGVIGGATGAANANPGEELQGAQRGAIVGAATGGAIPIGARTATAAARYTGLDQVPAALNRLTGGRIATLNGSVDRRALANLADAMRRDGVDPQTVRDTLNRAMTQGIDYNLLDALGENATRTRALVQGAAMRPGPAQTLAAQNRNQVAASLQDDAIAQARRLTGAEQRTAAQYRQGLDDTAENLAATDYLEPYNTRVPITPEIERALADMGPQLNQARQASSYRFPERAVEIEGLANPDEIVSDVSAGALDRIQRRLGSAGRGARRSIENPDEEMAADYFARQGAINQTLEGVPGLAPARATYRGYSVADDAVEEGLGALAPSRRAEDYADTLARLMQQSQEASGVAGRAIPSAREAAGVGVRDAIVNRIGNMGEGSTGFLNTVSTAPNPTAVLQSTFGPERAQAFQEGTGMLVDRLRNARFIDPSTGSQTASRLGAEDLVSNIPSPTLGGLAALLSKIRRGVTLTDADREAIVRLSTMRGNVTVPIPQSRAPQVSGRAAVPLAGLAGRE